MQFCLKIYFHRATRQILCKLPKYLEVRESPSLKKLFFRKQAPSKSNYIIALNKMKFMIGKTYLNMISQYKNSMKLKTDLASVTAFVPVVVFDEISLLAVTNKLYLYQISTSWLGQLNIRGFKIRCVLI